jgi:hypothetical protein
MAATNSQKTPHLQSLNRIAYKGGANSTAVLGKTLPCSVTKVQGSVVTVKFEINAAPFTLPPATMPVFGPEYIRYPIQVGCKGMAIAANAYLGGMSGLGVGVATLAEPPNLSALVFLPFGNVDFSAVDGNALVLYGPDGVVIRDIDSNCVLTLRDDGIATLQGNLHVTGAIIAGFGTGDQVGLQTHGHPQGADSHGDSEEPTGSPIPGT